MLYVLPYGQMSLWGELISAPNAFFKIYFNFYCTECLGYAETPPLPPLGARIAHPRSQSLCSASPLPRKGLGMAGAVGSEGRGGGFNFSIQTLSAFTSYDKNQKIKAEKRIGPHNIDILSIIFGTLLGDGHAEKRVNGTRISFYQEGSHKAYLLWLHSLISNLGYCNSTEPKLQKRLGVNNQIRYVVRFKTWTYSSFNWIYDNFYINNVKIVPSILDQFLTPLALAIWIMDDGSKVDGGLKLCTNSFSFADCNFLVKLLHENFNLKASVQSTGAKNKEQYHIYIWKETMPLLREIVGPYVHSSMKYKIL